MLFRHQNKSLAVLLLAGTLTACGALPARLAVRSTDRGPIVAQHAPQPYRHLTHAERLHLRHWFLAARRAEQVRLFLVALAAAQTIPADLVPVADCVKGHESGNYAESSHPSAGSGAYQYVPGTWRAWLARWQASLADNDPNKHRWWDYAYLAPAEVQDRTFVYTIRNGGAANWSNAYGYDPCTAGM